jgi:hypothetical protein
MDCCTYLIKQEIIPMLEQEWKPNWEQIHASAQAHALLVAQVHAMAETRARTMAKTRARGR